MTITIKNEILRRIGTYVESFDGDDKLANRFANALLFDALQRMRHWQYGSDLQHSLFNLEMQMIGHQRPADMFRPVMCIFRQKELDARMGKAIVERDEAEIERIQEESKYAIVDAPDVRYEELTDDEIAVCDYKTRFTAWLLHPLDNPEPKPISVTLPAPEPGWIPGEVEHDATIFNDEDEDEDEDKDEDEE